MLSFEVFLQFEGFELIPSVTLPRSTAIGFKIPVFSVLYVPKKRVDKTILIKAMQSDQGLDDSIEALEKFIRSFPRICAR